MVVQCQSIQNLIQTKIEKERSKSKKIRIQQLNKIKPISSQRVKKPILDDKGLQRLQLFKEHVRKELYKNEEYIFSENYQNKKENFLVQGTRDSSIQELMKFQNFQQEQISKQRGIISKLNEKMGI